MSPLLDVRGLTASYGVTTVLHGVGFSVPRGGITALLGANGAGKTTTLRAISGLVQRQGQIVFDGQPIGRLSTEAVSRLGIAHVPDGRGTLTQLSVEENLRVGAYTRRDRAGVAADYQRVYEYFPRLRERRDQQAGLLSGGEQQMLAIGRALMLRPRLLLMDEPSFGLAPLIIRSIFDIMQAISREQEVAVLLAEQNVAQALKLADHAYLLETGTMVMSGDSESIRRDERVRKSYLGLTGAEAAA